MLGMRILVALYGALIFLLPAFACWPTLSELITVVQLEGPQNLAR
jgi:hypothetical protein